MTSFNVIKKKLMKDDVLGDKVRLDLVPKYRNYIQECTGSFHSYNPYLDIMNPNKPYNPFFTMDPFKNNPPSLTGSFGHISKDIFTLFELMIDLEITFKVIPAGSNINFAKVKIYDKRGTKLGKFKFRRNQYEGQYKDLKFKLNFNNFILFLLALEFIDEYEFEDNLLVD